MPRFGARALPALVTTRTVLLLLSVASILTAPIWVAAGASAECRDGIGVSRTVEIDTTGGPLFGVITKQAHEKSFLSPKEVVLTFDDGPMPGVTKSILDTLDRFCTKATFFSVGQMAIAYPELVREVMQRGHTLGTHTWSHPMNLRRLKGEQARDQIESGFAAVSLAAGQPIAPFFRFPGLNDSPALLAHLESRDIAAFSVDVVSNDSYIADPGRLIDRTLAQVEADRGGIMLFHDIKPQTARALPTILTELKARGYKVVHMRAKAPFKPDDHYAAALQDRLTSKHPASKRRLLAITDAAGSAPTVSVVALTADRAPAAMTDVQARAPEPISPEAKSQPVPPGPPAWVTSVPAPQPATASASAKGANSSSASTEVSARTAGSPGRPVVNRQPRIINAEPEVPVPQAVSQPASNEPAKPTAIEPFAHNNPAVARENSSAPKSLPMASVAGQGKAAAKAAASEPTASEPIPSKSSASKSNAAGATAAATALGTGAARGDGSAGVEVIAGSYRPADSALALPKELEAGRFASPEIIAGNYRKPAPAGAPALKQDASVAAGTTNWIETFKVRSRDGN